MVKIEFDEATIEAANQNWTKVFLDTRETNYASVFAHFYAAAANRQLEALEKPVFEVGKKYRTRGGNIEGPLKAAPISNKYRDTHPLFCDGAVWRLDGQYLIVDGKKEHPNDLLPGAIEELGQADVSPPLVEGGSPALTDEEIGKELADTFRRVPVFTWTAVGRRARELLVPQGNVVIDDNFVCRPAYDEMQSRAEKAEADKAKAEAALEQLRDFAECLLNETSEQVASPGYYSGVRSAVEIAGFTIIPAIPAQPLKVLRHD